MTNKLCGCGGEPVVFQPEARKTEETWCVMCQGCTIRVFRRFREEAEAAWNRALSASQQAIPREPTEADILRVSRAMRKAMDDVGMGGDLLIPPSAVMRAMAIAAWDAAPSSEPSQPVTQWIKVSDQQPAPHAHYLVKRDSVIYTATPCYGMHAPWWVPRSMQPGKFEDEPVAMADTDEWQAALPSQAPT